MTEERRKRALTDEDVQAIANAIAKALVSNDCLSQVELFEVRGLISWWRAAKAKTGEIALKAFFTTILVGGAIIAWLTQPWR